MTDYFTFNFVIYLGRWLISTVVLMFPLMLLIKLDCCKSKYQAHYHLLAIQIIGAFIFYKIDALIFKG